MIRTFNMLGRPGDTFKLTSTATAQALAAAVLTDGGRLLCGLMITVDTNDVKIALGGATPVLGAGGLGHILKKDLPPIYIVGESACSSFMYITAVGTAHGDLQITPYYNG